MEMSWDPFNFNPYPNSGCTAAVKKVECTWVNGTVHQFYMGGPRNRLQSGIRITLSVVSFFDPCGRNGRFYGVTYRSNRVFAVLLLIDLFGLIGYTIKSNVAGIKKIKTVKTNHFPD